MPFARLYDFFELFIKLNEDVMFIYISFKSYELNVFNLHLVSFSSATSQMHDPCKTVY